MGSIKDRVIKACPDRYPIKSKVTFNDGTTCIIYSDNDYWKYSNVSNCARFNKTDVTKIERLEG